MAKAAPRVFEIVLDKNVHSQGSQFTTAQTAMRVRAGGGGGVSRDLEQIVTAVLPIQLRTAAEGCKLALGMLYNVST